MVANGFIRFCKDVGLARVKLTTNSLDDEVAESNGHIPLKRAYFQNVVGTAFNRAKVCVPNKGGDFLKVAILRCRDDSLNDCRSFSIFHKSFIYTPTNRDESGTTS